MLAIAAVLRADILVESTQVIADVSNAATGVASMPAIAAAPNAVSSDKVALLADHNLRRRDRVEPLRAPRFYHWDACAITA